MDQKTNPSQDLFRWIDTLGGPHILIPEEYLADWTGCDNWIDNSEDDPSDYARACRSDAGWLNVIPSQRCEIVVLGGERGSIAWVPTSDTSGTLVRWEAFDSDEAVLAMLPCKELGKVERLEDEKCRLETGPSGRMILLDATANGREVAPDEFEVISLRPGKYDLKAYYVETET